MRSDACRTGVTAALEAEPREGHHGSGEEERGNQTTSEDLDTGAARYAYRAIQ